MAGHWLSGWSKNKFIGNSGRRIYHFLSITGSSIKYSRIAWVETFQLRSYFHENDQKSEYSFQFLILSMISFYFNEIAF